MDTTKFKLIEQSDNTHIIEATSMAEVFELIQARPHIGTRVVAYDLDNTIMHPVQMLGSDQWFVEHFKHDTRDNTLALYNSAQFKTEVMPVETETAQTIANLQESGCIVIGLTARGKDLADTTAKQLLSVNVNFNLGECKDIEAPCASNLEQGLFKHGIMFCDGASKGIALKGLMAQLNINPDDVYFIDDSVRHIHDVKAHSDAHYTGIHYTHVRDIKGLAIDPNIVGMQIKYLDKILPDLVAKAVHEHHESELSNTHLKIEFKQKNEAYKPYAYFWSNHENDFNSIQDFFKPEETQPKIKHDFFAFKADHRVMACRVKVPLEKAAPLVGFLYQNHILKQQDLDSSNIQLTEVGEHISNSSISKLSIK